MEEEKALFLTQDEETGTPGPEEEAAHPMTALLEQADSVQQLERGQILEGVIVRLSPEEVLIDINAKSEGIVTKRDLDRLGDEQVDQLNVGDTVLAAVITPEDKNGNIILSLARAQIEKDWREAERLFKAQKMFEGTVAGFNKGGLIVRLGRVRGFVPASQVVVKDGGNIRSEEYKAGLVGQTLQLKVIELDRERNRLILSERAALREWRKKQKDKLLQELSEGDIRKGIVSSLCDFGAFVDLGQADGLVHLSELSWRRVAHPGEVLDVGQEVEVYVLNVDRERKRIGLSLKRLEPDPWTLVDEQYKVGQLVEGTITKLVKFGAFARLKGSDIEGLIHISELSDEHVTHPKEVVEPDEVVTLRVIKIDSGRRRMGLSLKKVDSIEYVDQDWALGRTQMEVEPELEVKDEADDSDELVLPDNDKDVPAPSEVPEREVVGEEV
jgi:small subunit ribosomal protein S1